MRIYGRASKRRFASSSAATADSRETVGNPLRKSSSVPLPSRQSNSVWIATHVPPRISRFLTMTSNGSSSQTKKLSKNSSVKSFSTGPICDRSPAIRTLEAVSAPQALGEHSLARALVRLVRPRRHREKRQRFRSSQEHVRQEPRCRRDSADLLRKSL